MADEPEPEPDMTEARAWLDSLAARLLWAEIVRTDDEQ